MFINMLLRDINFREQRVINDAGEHHTVYRVDFGIFQFPPVVETGKALVRPIMIFP
jgi:hypothetical protein